MTRFNTLNLFVFISLFIVSVASAANFTQCLDTFRANGNPIGGTDYSGKPVNNSKDAVALTYAECNSLCGTSQEAFNWSIFSMQFSAWLLPWLALVSQLPFGAESRLDNLISVILTVGSPTLAAFSLALTAVNTRWANERFSDIKYPNSRSAAKALICLQQVPIRLSTRDGLLASLVVLHENDDWWECLIDRLDQTYTWTIAAAANIVWVVVALVFTIIDSFMNLGSNVNSDGEGVGTIWLWLVPIVVGWLWTPVCPHDKLMIAIERANDIAYVATPDYLPLNDPRHASEVSHRRGIRIYKKKKVFTQDAARTSPVFNYARLWEWSSAVETIARAYECADKNAGRHIAVDTRRKWLHVGGKRLTIHPENRSGTIGQVQAYCGFPTDEDEELLQPVPSGMWKRVFVASFFALGLQWATTSSAAIIVIVTPTTGLGCRSASYLVYGAISTVIWLAMLSSSYLAHCAKVRHDLYGEPRPGLNFPNIAEGLATLLRRLSTFAAACNTLCIILTCVFQFSSFYSTCYCNSSVMGRGAMYAYSVIAPGYDFDHLKAVWIGAIVLAGGYVFVFLISLHLMLEPSSDVINS